MPAAGDRGRAGWGVGRLREAPEAADPCGDGDAAAAAGAGPVKAGLERERAALLIGLSGPGGRPQGGGGGRAGLPGVGGELVGGAAGPAGAGGCLLPGW